MLKSDFSALAGFWDSHKQTPVARLVLQTPASDGVHLFVNREGKKGNF